MDEKAKTLVEKESRSAIYASKDCICYSKDTSPLKSKYFKYMTMNHGSI